jgi:asparagine synthase (glutamine-hydrolysing)
MCGFVGIFDSNERRPIDSRLLRRMNDAIAHRGPDGDGEYVAPGIGLGHRRLAIIDVGGGQQPLYNEDGTVVVVFNGEIYNFADIKLELAARGHLFRTHCDTEVIVHGWEEWGADCVKRFRGMFAFALWDQNQQTLFMARDRLGKKPLYYARLAGGQVLFGSELKALVQSPALSRQLDVTAIEDYFAYGYVPDPRSIYRDVAKLPPAHTLVWKRGGEPRVERYWDLKFTGTGPRSEAEAREALIGHLREAVRLRLISEVPLGAFLSGGVDSSAVVALMAGLVDGPVGTYSIGFGDRSFDESAYARQLAEKYKTDHHVRQVDPDSFDLVERLTEIYDEPFGDSSAMPTYRVCGLAREHVTVALSGDGGDEVFAGYRRYLWQKREQQARALLPASLRRPLFGALGALYPKLDWAPQFLRAKTTFQELALDGVEGYFIAVSVANDAMRRRLFSPRLRSAIGGHRAIDVLRGHAAAANTDCAVSQVQYADIMTYLPGDILTKVDRASMAHSLEVRVPFLDHVFVEWAATLPAAMKIRGGERKHVLKRALEPHVPAELLYRPKQGFSIPLARWFRGPLAGRLRAVGDSELLGDTGYFDLGAIRGLIADHQSGARDHSATLWVLLMFDSFLAHDAGLRRRAEAA